MGVEAKKMMFLNTHMADWQTGRLTPKKGSQSAKSVGNLAKLGRLSNLLLYIYLSTSVCQGAKEKVCSRIFWISQSANFEKFGRLRSYLAVCKSNKKEVRIG